MKLIIIAFFLCVVGCGPAKEKQLVNACSKSFTETDLNQIWGGEQFHILQTEQSNGIIQYKDNVSGKEIVAILGKLVKKRKDKKDIAIHLFSCKGGELIKEGSFYVIGNKFKDITLEFNPKLDELELGFEPSSDVMTIIKWDGKKYVSSLYTGP